MADQMTQITPEQFDLIRQSKVFFVASAANDLSNGPQAQGPVNISPKGGTPLHVLDDHHVAYLDYAGSGNETARHAASDGPITVMVMSHDADNAAIVRLYGHARVIPLDEYAHADLLRAAPARDLELRVRQAVEITVESTATSCGYGVPVLEFVQDRVRAQRGRRYKE